MESVDLVVAIGADEQHVALVARGHEQLDHPQGGHIGPLQVVEEQHQRAASGREDVDETGKHTVQAELGLRRRHRGRRLGGADDERQLGNQVDHHDQSAPQGGSQLRRPLPHRGLGLAKKLAHQFLERLNQRRIGHVAPELVGFASQEAAAPGDDRFLHLVNYRRLADAGRTGHPQHCAVPASAALECLQQCGDRILAPVQRLRDHETGVVIGKPEPPYR